MDTQSATLATTETEIEDIELVTQSQDGQQTKTAPAIKYVDQNGNHIDPPPNQQQQAAIKYVDQYGNPVDPPPNQQKQQQRQQQMGEFRTATNDISACTQIRLITWKNYKSQVSRRKCSFCCKMCCPLIFILIMGFVGLLRPFFTQNVNCDLAEGSNDECPEIYIAPEEHRMITPGSITPVWYFADLICSGGEYEYDEDTDSWYQLEIPPPHYIAIVLNPNDINLKQRAQSILDIISTNYGSGQEYIYNASDGFECNEFARDPSNVNFTAGSLLKYFDTESDLEEYIRDSQYGAAGYTFSNDASNGALRPITAAVVFKSVSNDGKIWDYSLRFNKSNVASTFIDNEEKIVDRVTKDANQLRAVSIDRYQFSGFMGLQTIMDYTITEYIATEVNEEAYNTTYTDEFIKGYFIFPFTSYRIDVYWTFMQLPFNIFSTIMFIYPVLQIISVLVTEKATKIKEGMKMMGATGSIYWTSMYLWFTMEFTFICIIIVIFGFLMNVFLYSNGLLIILWFWLFCMSQMTFSTLISTFFDNPKTATIVGFVLYFILIGMGVAMQSMNRREKQLFCLLATPCFMESLNVVVQYESSLVGIQWDNLSEEVGQFSMATTLMMLFIDVILYLLLTLYLDNVWPTRFGQKRSPFYCLTKSFWTSCCCCFGGKNIKSNMELLNMNKLGAMNNYQDVNKKDSLKNKEPIIMVRDLSKTFNSRFRGSQVKAVRDLSLDIYPGEVFCLLGHNGAGKTTTISMLSGLLSVSGGDAYINGYNVNDNMNAIRKFLGVCPQHDVLWDKLTAEEHLRFFAKLKGVPADQINNELNRVINLFNMLDSGLWGKFPPTMSGGEKRRLSLAISLIGGSQIVFLDEPTSGMDPENRRKVWDIIQEEKKNRCIILTTHYMDEADILGDRIAIMSSGQIKCCGSSLYLKRLYGVGYTFTVSLKSGVNLEDERDASIKPEIDNILNEIDGAKTISIAASEILYKLPFESSGQFASIFMKLDDNKNNLQIETFGVSVTTLEEVFLKIGNHDIQSASMMSMSKEDDGDDDNKYDNNNNEHVEELRFEQAEFQLDHRNSICIFLIHIYAILYKRFWWSIRDIKGLICQIILPVVLIGLLFGLKSTIQINQIELQLTPQQYTRDGFTDSVVVPLSKLPNNYMDINMSNITNLYYTDNNGWSDFYFNEMQSEFGNNLSYSIGNVDRTCLYEISYPDQYNNNGDTNNNGDGSYYSVRSDPNCTANFQRAIYSYSNDDNTPYFGFWFNPIGIDNYESEVLLGVNASSYHSLPIAYNTWNNWVLKNIYNNDAEINVYSYPFPLTRKEESDETAGEGLGTTINLIIAFTLIPASSIYFVVNEKTIGTKHQQFVSGISIASYWIGTYLSDILLGIPASSLVIMLVYIFDVDEFKHDATIPLFISLLLFVSSSIAAGYLLHFLFKSAGKAQFITILFNILLGVLFTIITFVLDSIGSQSTDETSEDMKTGVRILPIFCLAENILRIVSKPFENPNKTYWDHVVTKRNINIMIFESLGYFGLVLLIEYARSFPSLLAKLGFVVDQPRKFMRLDDDVAAEQERIKIAVDFNGNLKEGVLEDTVILAGLRKVYKGENKFTPYKPAVRDMYFGVKQGEVFGFLGVNGAGKTSTLQLLTGENYPSSGIGYIAGKSIVTEQLAIRRNIGFCPQNDAIFDLLTAYEHLKFYALIKGLNGGELEKQINVLLSALTLNKYSKRTATTYSGGNKRKLCVAQAMIGNPPVIFMDEPSTGMDPVSRRFMWKFINQTMAGRCVILTTHSMEECEALCNRVGIMVDGQLSCIGSPQYLKSKFGKGYQLDITLKDVADDDIDDDEKYGDNNNNIHQLLEEFNKTFPTTILQENGNKILLEIREYDINDTSSKLSALGEMFEFVENVKIKYEILSYALSQTSLEQVFLKMAEQKGIVEQHADITMEQRELLNIIKRETKDELLKRIAILNRDHLESILENEIKNASQYIVKALTASNNNNNVPCICGSAMIAGVIKQGQPKCANINCSKDIINDAESNGNCYYCPNNSSTMHPNGFFYCNQCANAVKTSGGTQKIIEK